LAKVALPKEFYTKLEPGKFKERKGWKKLTPFPAWLNLGKMVPLEGRNPTFNPELW